MIELQNLNKIYNAGLANQVNAIQNVNLTIQKKDFVVIVGANGSGKSTLLNLISGNVLPSSGKIFIDESDVTRLPDFKRSKAIARVFQNPFSGTAADLSILDNFRLAALRTQSKTLKIGVNQNFKNKVAKQVAQLGMGLEDKLDQQMGSLSGGQRQALTLLMAVMDDLKILLLDEPTAALDPRSAQVVMQLANQLTQQFKLCTILITHNLKEAFTQGNRIIQMTEGKIIKDLDINLKNKLTQNEIFNWFS
ncbi:MAG: ATP-binding cassette domain-containing protein [Sphingobacteriales bacterium]|nr:MAG: ATP-binding cassette domain-containing protein [Sphingobacteriales bacterium]